MAGLEAFAVVAAEASDHRVATALLAATEAARHEMSAEPNPVQLAVREQALKLLDQSGAAAALGGAEDQVPDLAAALALAEAADLAPA